MTFENPEELYARSDAVFVGTVVAKESTGAKGAHQIIEIATIRIERSWKGRFQREVRVGTDAHFELRKSYVVFASGAPLTTSIECSASERVDRAKRKLDWLATKPNRTAG